MSHPWIIFFVLTTLSVYIAGLTVLYQDVRPNHNRVVACYVSTWATYRKGDGQFNIEHIDPSLCTNIIYAFAGLNSTTSSIRSLDPFNDLEEDYGKGSYKKMTGLRKKHPHLTVSIAIGGWNEGSANYSALAADPEKRSLFVSSVISFMKKYDFNGFDLDWEFPAKRGGAPEDKENFVMLVKMLHDAMKPYGWSLTAALGAGKDTMDVAYNLTELNKYLDHVHLMCYDYHGKWDSVTGANAPLRSALPMDVNTVEYSVKYMLDNGIEPNKLVLGLPMYGRTFLMKDETQGNRLGVDSMSTAFSGPITNEEGFMGYNEICMELNKSNSTWKRMWDESTMTPFAVNGQQVIVYDDKESLKHKVRFAMDNNLGGLMIWSIDIDDFRGLCVSYEGQPAAHHKYPLLTSVNEAIITSLKEIEEERSQTTTTSTTTMTPTTTISTSTSTETQTPGAEPSSASSNSMSAVLLFATWFLFQA